MIGAEAGGRQRVSRGIWLSAGLEGMLLAILRKPVPEESKACKQALQVLQGANMTKVEDYARDFPKSVLEQARGRVPALDKLLSLPQPSH